MKHTTGGADIIDTDMKAFYVQADGILITKAVDGFKSCKTNSKSMCFRVKVQLNPNTLAQCATSDKWVSIDETFDLVGLMKLLQTLCVHGSGKEYGPELIMSSFLSVLHSRQGKQSPSEFSVQLGSNEDVLEE